MKNVLITVVLLTPIIIYIGFTSTPESQTVLVGENSKLSSNNYERKVEKEKQASNQKNTSSPAKAKKITSDELSDHDVIDFLTRKGQLKEGAGFEELENLKKLSLKNVKPEDLPYLSKLTHLKDLTLYSDRKLDLSHLKDLKSLEKLKVKSGICINILKKIHQNGSKNLKNRGLEGAWELLGATLGRKIS